MKYSKTQQQAIDWALNKIQSSSKNLKYFNLTAIVLTLFDVICSIVTLIYATMTITSIVSSILCGSAWSTRAMQIMRMQKLIDALKYPAMFGLAYIITRKRRSEFMQNIKVRNWIIAGLNAAAIILGVVLVFVEPNVITDNVELVITGLGALLGVNIAIPCFNNAKTTEEEKTENAEKKKIKQAVKQAKANLKEQAKSQLNDETLRVLDELSKEEQASTSSDASKCELVDNSNSETIEQSEQNTNFAEAMHSSVDTTQINNHTIDGETITPSVEANADANGDVSVPNNADTISNDSMTSASRQN